MTALAIMALFGATGEIGPIRCGASLNSLAETLGPPWDIGRISRRRRWPRLFSYGHVELCVCHCRTVTMISVQARHDPIELPDPATNVLTAFPSHLTLRQITDSLDAARCRRRVGTAMLELRTEPAGVGFVFRAGHAPEPLLEQAGCWITEHECVPPPHGLPDDGFGV
ncbi:hypothetical protein AB0K40_44435 [Nonomuraea bangladeshensis]|uniref:Uncharacterized protein n=1 Tax=Nonomuraea bangladeshensis TaxID=404385 RepID=A0ABV3HKH6_9ACTN